MRETLPLFTSRTVLGFLVSFLLSASVAAPQSPDVATTPTQFNEVYRTTVPTAGGVILGVISEPTGSFQGWFSARVPGSGSRMVCVDVNSIDGRYWAHAEYHIDGAERLQRFSLPTRYLRDLGVLPPRAIAVAATVATRCDGLSNNFLVAGWSSDGKAASTVILINIQASVSASIFGPPSGVAYCARDNPAAVAFTASCRLPLGAVAPAQPLVLRRSRFESRLPDISFFVVEP